MNICVYMCCGRGGIQGYPTLVYFIFSADDLLVSGSGDNTARIWSLQSLECLHVLESHTDDVNCVVIKVHSPSVQHTFHICSN